MTPRAIAKEAFELMRATCDTAIDSHAAEYGDDWPEVRELVREHIRSWFARPYVKREKREE